MEMLLRPLLGADIELKMRLSSDLWNLQADPGQIDQVVMNLAINASDAMPEGGTLTIETSNVEVDEEYGDTHYEVSSGAHVMLAVTDTGIGIEKEAQARIFEPFFTTKEKGKGTGLGLATVFGIVKQSGGHIWVYSEPGHGTTFKVYFPKVGGAAETLPPQRPAPESVRGSETLLLAEDDDRVRAVAAQILRRHGYVVLEAVNAADALVVAEKQEWNIDLLLTDVVMPGQSGRLLAERLQRQRPETRVLYLSGYTDDAILQHGLLTSGVAFLQKPFTPDSLARKVRDILDGRRGS
jgi:CheY-like chemotaxis protein